MPPHPARRARRAPARQRHPLPARRARPRGGPALAALFAAGRRDALTERPRVERARARGSLGEAALGTTAEAGDARGAQGADEPVGLA
ncbi:hypothetical protein ACFWE0_25055, partial [Streptomyces diastaticus]